MAKMWIHKIDMDICDRGLDGLYTTVEEFINKMKDNLTKSDPFTQGYAATKHHDGVNDKVRDDGTSMGWGEKSSSNPALRW